MSYKYLGVVEDGTDKFVPKAKEYYKIIEQATITSPAIIESLHGYEMSLAAREYCINNKTTTVIVRYYTPESKYNSFKEKEYTVDESLLAL